MGYVIHTVIHFLFGASLFYIVLNKDFVSKMKRIFAFSVGGFAAIAPDITKFFGDLYGHSLWAVPVFGILIAMIARLYFKKVTLWILWLACSISVLSHIFIDFIGNGVAFLFPFSQAEFDFYIITDNHFVFFLLPISMIVALIYKRDKIVILSSLLIIVIFFGILSYSKIQLEQELKKRYQADSIILLLTYPGFDDQWEFQVRTDKSWITGVAPRSIFSADIQVEQERNVED